MSNALKKLSRPNQIAGKTSHLVIEGRITASSPSVETHVSEVKLRDIPITFLSADGSVSPDVARGLPCIRIGYTPQIERINSEFDNKQISQLWALIDTGATFNVVDETVCALAP